MPASLESVLSRSSRHLTTINRYDPSTTLYRTLAQISDESQKFGPAGAGDRHVQGFVASQGIDQFRHEQLVEAVVSKHNALVRAARQAEPAQVDPGNELLGGIVQSHQKVQLARIDSAISRAIEDEPVSAALVSMPVEKTVLSSVESQVAEILASLNQHRQTGNPYPLIPSLLNALDSRVMRTILGLLQDVSEGGHTSQAWKTRRFLEKSFLQFVESVVGQFPRESSQRGKPSISDKVHGFVHIKFSRTSTDRLEAVNRVLVWVNLFYLYRCGDLDSMLHFVQTNDSLFYRQDKLLIRLILGLRDLPGRPLASELYSMVVEEYTAMTSQGDADPFKLVLYESLGRLESKEGPHHQAVLTTVEDWIWYHLTLVDHETGSGLKEFQARVLEMGPHFEQAGGALYYCKAMVECCLYEQAMGHAFQQGLVFESMCLAAALSYHRLLIVSEPPMVGVSVASIVDGYVSSRVWPLPSMAMDHILILSLAEHPWYQRHTVERLAAWILETRAFELIHRLDQLSLLVHSPDHTGFSALVAHEAAVESQNSGRLDDAVQLFHLAGEYQQALDILSQHLSLSMGSDQHNAAKCRQMLDHYRQDPAIAHGPGVEKALRRLHCLVEIDGLCMLHGEKKWAQILARLETTGLFRYAEETASVGFWRSIDLVVSRHLPRLVKMLVESVHHSLRPGSDQGSREQEQYLRRVLRFAVVFCSQLSLPSEVNLLVARADSQLV